MIEILKDKNFLTGILIAVLLSVSLLTALVVISKHCAKKEFEDDDSRKIKKDIKKY